MQMLMFICQMNKNSFHIKYCLIKCLLGTCFFLKCPEIFLFYFILIDFECFVIYSKQLHKVHQVKHFGCICEECGASFDSLMKLKYHNM